MHNGGMPALPPDLIAGLDVTATRPLGGGSIGSSFRLQTAAGPMFAKTYPDPQPGLVAAEAAGLRALRAAAPAQIGVPEVVRRTETGLVLEWVEPGRGASEADLGRGLAAIHRHTAPDFGALSGQAGEPGFIGSVPIDLTPTRSWPEYYLERRLRPLAHAAVDRGSLDPRFLSVLDNLAPRVADLCGPPEVPALIHGDLWGGNRMQGADNRNWLIDPAAHYSHRELDLAMMLLFGGFGQAAIAAYDEAFPLMAGWRERVAWYQLPPLLVHAILFAGHYGISALQALQQYR